MKVIFHGDDFGLTPGINSGIIAAHKHGRLSSASIVACGAAFEQAVSLAKENQGLDLGVHLVITDEQPIVSAEYLSSIISKGGCFPNIRKIFFLILARKIDYRQVEVEWCAQIDKCLQADITISHLDSHQFVHLFPGLLPLALRLARRYKIPYVRTTSFGIIHRPAGLKRFLEWMVLKFWIRIYVSSKLPPDLKTIPSLGFLQAGGKMSLQTMVSIFDKIMANRLFPAVEVMLHPAIADAETISRYNSWHYEWEKDLALLQNADLATALDRRGIEITSFRELV